MALSIVVRLLAFAISALVLVALTPNAWSRTGEDALARLRAEGFVLLDTANQEVRQAHAAVDGLLQRLVDPKLDGDRPFQLLLVDSRHVNAAILRGEGGSPNYVLVNTGLLEMVKSDDELAFVLSHELEHGISQIHDYLEKMNDRYGGASSPHRLFLNLIGRVEENEVDVKALRRVVAAKYNPYAAEDFMKTIAERYGDAPGASHTMWLARRSAVGSALTVATRGFGVKLDHKQALQSAVRSEVSSLVEGKKADARRAAQIRDLVERPTAEFSKEFRKIKLGKTAPETDYDSRGNVIDDEYYKRLRRYSEITGDSASAEETLQFRANMYSRLIEQRDRAFQEILGEAFKPRTAVQMERIVTALSASTIPPVFRGSGSNHVMVLDLGWRIEEVNQRLKRIEERLANSSGDELMEYRAQQAAKRAELKVLADEMELHIRRLPPTLLGRPTREVVSEGVQAIVAARRRNSSGDAVSRKVEDAILSATKDANYKQSKEKNAKLSRYLQSWMSETSPSFEGAEYRALSGFFRFGDEDFWRRNASNIMGRAKTALGEEFDKIEDPTERTLQVSRAFDFQKSVSGYWLKAAPEAEAAKISAQILQNQVDLHRSVVARAKSSAELFGLIPFAAGEFGQGYRGNGFGVAPEHVTAYYNEAFASQLLKRTNKILVGDLKQTKTNQEVLATVDGYLKSLLKLRSDFPNLKSEIESVVKNVKSTTVEVYQNRFFGRENAAVAKLRAEALFDGQYAKDLKEILPVEVSVAKRHLNALSQIAGRKELQGLVSVGGIEQVAADAGLSLGQRISELRKSDGLIGRNSSVRILSAEEVKATAQFALRLARDPETVGLSAKAVKIENRYEYPEANKKLLGALEDNIRHETHGTLWTVEHSRTGQLPDAKGQTRILNRLIDIWGPKTITDDMLGVNDSDTLRALTSSVDEALDVSSALVDVSRERLRSNGRGLGFDPDNQRLISEFKGKNLASRVERQLEKLLERGFGFDASEAEIRGILKDVPVEKITNYLAKTAEYSKGSKVRDLMLEQVFEAAKKDPKVLLGLRDPRLVQSFRFKENRDRLAQWQLEDALSLDERARVAKASRAPVAEKESVRNVVQRAKRLLDQQYPELSAEKSAAVERVEQKILTTVAESRYLKESRLGSNNWMQVRELAGLDLPSFVASAGGNSPIARLEMAEYLLGERADYPTFLKDYFEMRPGFEEEIEAAKKHFLTSDVVSRSYALQSFMDDANGIFSDPALAERVYRRILGDNASNPAIREVFTAYLDDLPTSERNVIISYIYSSFAENREIGKSAATLKTILEAMGPMGVKAGQFLRSSGRLSKAQAQDLDHFFSNALPPTRPMIYDDLAKATGESLEGLAGVRQMVGSGSINYGVRVTTDEGADVVARFRKPHVEGQIANENSRWERVIQRLAKSDNQEVRRLSSFLEEARVAAISTLGQGGVELDLSHERRMYEMAKKAYGAPADAKTGFRVEVVKPIESLQARVPEESQKLVSFYEYIGSTDFKGLPKEQQQQLARQILGSELDAIFKRGAFDPDGHIGNWMIDVKNKRLVRIDYAQLRALSPKEAAKIGEIVNLLFLPRPNASDISRLASGIESVIEIPPGLRLSKTEMEKLISEALAASDAPSGMEPHLRLLHLRDAVERRIETKSGKVLALKLKSDASAVLSSIGRMMYYRDLLPTQEFAAALKSHMKTPIERVFVQTPGSTKLSPAAARVADKALQVLDRGKQVGRSLIMNFNCAKEFLRLKLR